MPATDGQVTGASPALARVERVWFPHFIRAVACLVIVYEHLAIDYLISPVAVRTLAFTETNVSLGIRPPAAQMQVYEWLARLQVSPGQVAIFLFFLVSGFVIPFSLERRTVQGFLVRRFFRVYPTLWVGMAFTLGVLALQAYLLDAAFPFGMKSIASSAALVSVYVGQPWVDSIYWTLAVEELFYGLAVLAAWRRALHNRGALVLGAVGMAVICLAMVPSDAPAAPSVLWWFRLGLSRNIGFAVLTLVGVVFHNHYVRRWDTRSCVLLTAAVFGAWFAAVMGGPFPGNQAFIYFNSSVGATLVFWAFYVLRDRVPYSRAIDALGNISYPLYLLHIVTGFIVMHSLYERIHSFYVVVPLTIAVVLALAAILHKLVETPAMELGRRVSSRPRFRRPDQRQPPDLRPPVAPGVETA